MEHRPNVRAKTMKLLNENRRQDHLTLATNWTYRIRAESDSGLAWCLRTGKGLPEHPGEAVLLGRVRTGGPEMASLRALPARLAPG